LGSVAKYKAFSQYQEVQRDIALVLDKTTPVAEKRLPETMPANLFDCLFASTPSKHNPISKNLASLCPRL
jgi:hypothetical protein